MKEFKSRNHGKKSDKQLDSYLKSANPKDTFYLGAIMEKQKRVLAGKWTR
jgi:hypothetical protein